MHLRTLARRLGSVALAASLALGAAACSDGTEGASPVEGRESTSEDAGSEDTSTEDTSTEDTSTETTEPEVEEESTEEATAEAPTELSAADFYPSVMGALKDAETFAFESSTGVGGQAMNVSGQARYDDSGMAMKATATGAQPMEMIMLDQVIYMKSPQLSAGDKWLKIDLTASENSLYGMLAKATDPEAMFKAMETPKKLEVVGTEEVDGVATNHYRVTMDPQDYIKAMGFPAEMSSFLPDELVTDMWVDADNLPRKFSQTVEAPSPAGGKPVTTTTEGLYSDFGTDVEIEAPPASDVTDAPALPGA